MKGGTLLRWDRHFLDLARCCAMMSKDPSTKVGAVVVGPDREVRSTSFNGFPRGIADDDRLGVRETKLRIIVHAEVNAILNAARIGVAVKGCTLYLAASDPVDGTSWGGPPCTRCTVEVIQAGIAGIVSPPRRLAPSRWHDDLDFASQLLAEAGVFVREIEP